MALTIKLAKRLRARRQLRERVVNKDITRGREATAIMAVNQVDDEDFPTDFVYVADYVETTPIAVNRVVTSIQVYAVRGPCSAFHRLTRPLAASQKYVQLSKQSA